MILHITPCQGFQLKEVKDAVLINKLKNHLLKREGTLLGLVKMWPELLCLSNACSTSKLTPRKGYHYQ